MLKTPLEGTDNRGKAWGEVEWRVCSWKGHGEEDEELAWKEGEGGEGMGRRRRNGRRVEKGKAWGGGDGMGGGWRRGRPGEEETEWKEGGEGEGMSLELLAVNGAKIRVDDVCRYSEWRGVHYMKEMCRYGE